MPYETQVAHEAVETEASPEQIFDLASVRRLEFDLDYAGAVTPPEAWRLVQSRAAALIDVRTAPEYKFVGRVPHSVNVEWQGDDPLPRRQFIEALRKVADPDAPLLLLCRSAVRSDAAAAAATEAGFKRVYNVLEGFEGQRDAAQQRGHIDGWRHAGLPWVQD